MLLKQRLLHGPLLLDINQRLLHGLFQCSFYGFTTLLHAAYNGKMCGEWPQRKINAHEQNVHVEMFTRTFKMCTVVLRI